MAAWGSPVERERKLRIDLAVWAYAYELLGEPIVDDATFDDACSMVDLSVPTGNRQMDAWFRREFDPSTGMWVHRHPGRARLDEIARMVLAERRADDALG